jgi:hypothetical protein
MQSEGAHVAGFQPSSPPSTFSLGADAISTLADDPAVELYIEETMVARVRLERVP